MQRLQKGTLLLGGGLFVLLSVWMLVGETAAPRFPWGMPGSFPPGDTCIAASWAAYNCYRREGEGAGGERLSVIQYIHLSESTYI